MIKKEKDPHAQSLANKRWSKVGPRKRRKIALELVAARKRKRAAVDNHPIA